MQPGALVSRCVMIMSAVQPRSKFKDWGLHEGYQNALMLIKHNCDGNTCI